MGTEGRFVEEVTELGLEGKVGFFVVVCFVLLFARCRFGSRVGLSC